ncbi:MAG: hypothetical protein ISR58_21175 [Anaerolineales bacterium]|nr:hypothetical protein [Chloroflexota bacterium]MBL6983703.1 hypothetical protein [Anaerolineales bacterium]
MTTDPLKNEKQRKDTGERSDSLIDIIRFSNDPLERSRALAELQKMGLVEDLDTAPQIEKTELKAASPKKARKRKITIGCAIGIAISCIMCLLVGAINDITSTNAEATASARAKATSNARKTATAASNLKDTATAQSVQPLLYTATHWPLVLFEEFDATALNRVWFLGSYDDAYLKGSQYIVQNEYQWKAAAHRGFVSAEIPDIQKVSDFYIEAEMRETQGLSSAISGLIFRYISSGNYYFFEARANQYFRVDLIAGGKWFTIIDWTKSNALQRDSINKLAVLAKGSRYLIFINDQFVGEFEDERLPAGKTGLGISLNNPGDEAIFIFDNFELRAP